jgi:hypothetical protein
VIRHILAGGWEGKMEILVESGQDVLTYVRYMTEYRGTAGKITRQSGGRQLPIFSGRLANHERQAGIGTSIAGERARWIGARDQQTLSDRNIPED